MTEDALKETWPSSFAAPIEQRYWDSFDYFVQLQEYILSGVRGNSQGALISSPVLKSSRWISLFALLCEIEYFLVYVRTEQQVTHFLESCFFWYLLWNFLAIGIYMHAMASNQARMPQLKFIYNIIVDWPGGKRFSQNQARLPSC